MRNIKTLVEQMQIVMELSEDVQQAWRASLTPEERQTMDQLFLEAVHCLLEIFETVVVANQTLTETVKRFHAAMSGGEK